MPPLRLSFALMLALDEGSTADFDLMRRRWVNLDRNKPYSPQMETWEFPTLDLAWSAYLGLWSHAWFDYADPVELADLLMAWRGAGLNTKIRLGDLFGRVEEFESEDEFEPAETWCDLCTIDELRGIPASELEATLNQLAELATRGRKPKFTGLDPRVVKSVRAQLERDRADDRRVPGGKSE
jgi:hypothetical protein